MEDIKTIDLGALRALAKQRSLVMEELFTLVENALLLAYMKQPGAIKGSRAVIDPEQLWPYRCRNRPSGAFAASA